ncbi:MAG TPA: hypothetical protein PLP74_15015 [Quisquiliibacterium sp.]|nr:hypothetical protein [Quisquiliibacterium sp.]HQN13428.1 hypothetical protein [Quisquiliibacterium sp.]
MPTPRDYFTDPSEKLIAETAWAIAANPSLDSWSPVAYMSFWKYLPHTHNQIVLARAWITERRETPNRETGRKDGGVSSIRESIEFVLNARDVKVTATHVANVEHFFTSALITAIGGLTAGPVLAGASSVFWEMVVGPYALVVVHTWNTDMTKQGALESARIIGTKIVNGLNNNYRQVTGPDQRGIAFAMHLGLGGPAATRHVKDILKDYYDASNQAPPGRVANLAKVTRRMYKVRGGESLSAIAKWFYQGEMWRWPVLYARNRAVIGDNYNRVREGIEIELPLPWEMSGEELAMARVKHQQWNAAGRW